jgi:hypothetical protein
MQPHKARRMTRERKMVGNPHTQREWYVQEESVTKADSVKWPILFATRFSMASTENVVALLHVGHCALRWLPSVTDSLHDFPLDQPRKMEIHDGTS